MSDDLRHSRADRRDEMEIGASEKNKYLSGLLGLFGSVSEATRYFEHPFWGPVLTSLCRPEISQQVRDQVRTRVTEQAPAFVADFQRDRDAAVDWLTEEVIEAGKRIPRAENLLDFADLVTSHKNFVEGLTTDWERSCASEMDLKRDLFALTEAGVLLQGFEITCGHCISRFWYHVDDVRAVVRCFGCRQQLALPVERPWSYRPNELLWKAVRDYGLLPVIRTIHRLHDGARNSFIFASGIAFYEYQDDYPHLTHELDLTWVKDTEFGIAEIKQSARSFKTKDCERLITIAKRARPTKVLLVAVEGDDSKLSRWQRQVEGVLKPLGIVTDVLGPSVFSTPSRGVW